MKFQGISDVFLFLFFFLTQAAGAQKDSLNNCRPKITVSGYFDIFYAFDFNEPESNSRLNFLYNHNRHNQVNLNLGILKVAAEHEKYRANFALQGGTYSMDNYVNEPELFKLLYEVNAGISISKKNKLWLDAGIFGSHIGFESAISMDSWTLTRSLLAENSPYYLAGAKLTYKPNDHWEIAGIVCDGWQRIKPLVGNSLPGYCTQLSYSNGRNIKLNWSTFSGTDDPDSTRRMRYFNNFYGQFQISGKIGLIAGFDIGLQQKIKASAEYNLWYSPVVIVKYDINEKWRTALRAEYYFDDYGVIISTSTPNGFQTGGVSLNIDYSLRENILCRIEGRYFNSKDKIFSKKNIYCNDDCFIVASVAMKFSN